MQTSLYCSHWEKSDAKELGIPAPEFEIEHDDGTFYLRVKAGYRYQRSEILITLTRDQLEALTDAGKTALQDADPQACAHGKAPGILCDDCEAAR